MGSNPAPSTFLTTRKNFFPTQNTSKNDCNSPGSQSINAQPGCCSQLRLHPDNTTKPKNSILGITPPNSRARCNTPPSTPQLNFSEAHAQLRSLQPKSSLFSPSSSRVKIFSPLSRLRISETHPCHFDAQTRTSKPDCHSRRRHHQGDSALTSNSCNVAADVA